MLAHVRMWYRHNLKISETVGTVSEVVMDIGDRGGAPGRAIPYTLQNLKNCHELCCLGRDQRVAMTRISDSEAYRGSRTRANGEKYQTLKGGIGRGKGGRVDSFLE